MQCSDAKVERECQHPATQSESARQRAGDGHGHDQSVLLGRKWGTWIQEEAFASARQPLGGLAYRIGDEDDPVLSQAASVAEGKEHVDNSIHHGKERSNDHDAPS